MAILVSACTSTTTDERVLPGQTPTHGTPITAAWAEIVAGLDSPFADRDATICHQGKPECLSAVVAEMEARLTSLGCAHTAPFAFTYLEMTKGVTDALDTFDDPALISVIDARFAQLYFDAIDNWTAGRVDDVPAVWQLAFSAADLGTQSATLDLILGMNSHISRDLAYVVSEVVITDPLMGGEPLDYLLVNEVIGAVKSPMLAGAARRFDPNLFLLDVELDFDEAPDPVALIAQWRSVAFDLGLRLARAADEDERQAIVAEIERTAAAGAGVLRAAAAVDGSQELIGEIISNGTSIRILTPAERDAYCEEHRPPAP